ncbi:MAG: hypothetical protein K1565_12340 [Candidatus Thiodiazotropha sp. (ex. Lucinisca nassula)]|nr:hypothetical protein [Candidatus Thiodiazotropha sp. (ex. Lucinisca nassula)]
MKLLPEMQKSIGPECTSYRFSYLNHYYSILALFNYGWLLYTRPQDIRDKISAVKIKGIDNLYNAVKREKAIVAFSAHIGCFFNILFSDRVLSAIDERSVCLLVPSTKDSRREQMQAQLSDYGKTCQLIDITKKTSAIRIIRALKCRSIIGCNLDYAYPFTKNKSTPFLGRVVDMPVGILELSRKYAATYLPAYSYIDSDGIVIEFQEPFDAYYTDNAESDITRIAKQINSALEEKIKEVPEQWGFWARLLNAPSVELSEGKV